KVHLLDPATGTGTFLLGVADRVRRDLAAEMGPGQAPLALRGLAKRMYGFELLVGPYAVAHYRLHHALSRDEQGAPGVNALPRLGVYLTDTLAEPGSAAPAGVLGFVSDGIRDERLEANRIKSEQPILAILGNPPYRRLAKGENETLVGRWMDGLWDDLKAPVREAGWGNQLNTFPELSVAFWRWAIWKMFESPNAPKRGVVAFITNRNFLTGKPYAGLRRMMRRRFDRIEIVDLRGDVRAGERAGVENDQGVFNIQVGTAITLAVADGSRPDGALAEVAYNDCWSHGLTARRGKLAWLAKGAAEGVLTGAVAVERAALDDMRPPPFFSGELVNLTECFDFTKSGMKSGSDDLFVSFDRFTLEEKIKKSLFSSNPLSYTPSFEKHLAYRPFDNRVFYNDLTLLNRPGPAMQSVWGLQNFGLYAMPFGTAAGPAVWCHGLLPDYHAFSGRGGYAFPLFDRRPGHGPYNLNSILVAALGAAYGAAVAPEQVFDAMLALLSASSYTMRFAEDLEDTFPHLPFPADPTVFLAAAELGASIREVETFARKPGAGFLKGVALLADEPKGRLAIGDWQNGNVALCADGTGRFGPIPKPVWEFEVSGYRVLPRWLAAREGIAVDANLTREVRDLVGRIGELLDLFARADSLLDQAIHAPLSRAALGFAADEKGGDDGED
ncbi:MAG: hypothetical protein JOZ27_08065, partial [Caulobacteraceae bacterium]|nr:hypothetical protein [Caulobacteraceae bacterium]